MRPGRYVWLAALVAFGAVVVPAAPSAPGAPAQTPAQPNVVIEWNRIATNTLVAFPPAAGGAPELAGSCKRVIVLMRQSRRSFGINVLGTLVGEIEAADGTIGFAVTTGGEPAAYIVEHHLARFLEGRDPACVEQIWDQMYFATQYYGRKGLVVNAISGVDLALWDLLGRLRREPAPAPDSGRDVATARDTRALTLLVLVNMVNALGVSLIAPLLPYWFNVKFGVGPSAIGPVYSVTFFLTGAFALVVGRMSETLGLVRSIILPRVLGVALLVAIPFMPSFSFAAVLYVARSIVNRSSMGARQAFSVGLVRDRRRGLATSLNAVTWSLAGAFGPAVGGWLIGMGSLVWPFIGAAVLQTGYVVLFPTVLGRYDTTAPAPSARDGRG